LIQGRERKVSYKSKKVAIAPESEWVVVKDNHAPIIDDDTFYKVQQLMGRKRRRHGHGPNKKPHPLAGKLLCADCGSTMQRSGTSRDGKTYYLRCKLSAMTKRRDCTPHCVSQDKVERAVAYKMRGLIHSVMDVDNAGGIIGDALLLIDKEGNIPTKIEKQLMEVESKIEAVRKNTATAYVDKLNGIISEEDFLSFKEVFENERRRHIAKKEHLKRELLLTDTRQNAHEDIGLLLEKYKEMDTLTHEIVNDFIDTIYIGEKDPETKEQPITINWLL